METLGNMSVGSYCKYKQWLLIEARWSIFIVLFTLFRNVRQIWWFERLCVFTGARKIGAVMVFLFNGKCITNLKPGECSTFTVFLHNTNSFRKVKICSNQPKNVSCQVILQQPTSGWLRLMSWSCYNVSVTLNLISPIISLQPTLHRGLESPKVIFHIDTKSPIYRKYAVPKHQRSKETCWLTKWYLKIWKVV